MERNFTDENMEEFLKRNADGLFMRPSAKVWKGISAHLQRRRKKFGFFLGTTLLLTTALGYYLVNESSSHYYTTPAKASTKMEKRLTPSTSFVAQPNQQLIATIAPVRRNNTSPSTTTSKQQDFSFVQHLLQQNEQTVPNAFTPAIVDDSFLEPGAYQQNKLVNTDPTITDPLSIESVVNSYKRSGKKLTWQGYFTPTISYRTLNDPTIKNYGIAHKPAFGFQLGTTAKYAVTKNTRLRAGLQLNVNRYEIRTKDSYAQLATIRLNDRNGVDYIRTTTNYNNFTGYETNWLQNMYVQLSAPVGVEVKLSGSDKTQFGIASTVQPTYLLGDKAYLISDDYKNYVEMPGLVRHWNINTSLETYVGYSTGHINWQVGPQVRYQMLSSYLKKYPVKEHLFDFGLRVGMSFNK
ncbi:MAG: hypothetical protein ACXVBJ_08860 [Flavisolibacter sp.]